MSPQPPHPTSTQSPHQEWRGAECEAVVEEEQPSAAGDGAGAAPEGLSSGSPGMSQAGKAGPALPHLGQRDTPGPAEPWGLCLHHACHAAPPVPIAWVWGQGTCLGVLMVANSTSDGS